MSYGDNIMKRQAGFTLVEIAIVLVVIGLLLGGVLKGQELIMNSQIRNAINEFNNVAAARFTYQDRYRQIPGDDDSASGRWTGVTNGNGDRTIGGAWNTDPSGTPVEANYFWQHLRNDGLVSGPLTATGSLALPRNAFDGDIGVQDGAFGGSVTTPAIPGPTICQSNVPGKAAAIIDTRIDDDPGDGSGSNTGSLQGGKEPITVQGGTAEATGYALDDTRFTICRAL